MTLNTCLVANKSNKNFVKDCMCMFMHWRESQFSASTFTVVTRNQPFDWMRIFMNFFKWMPTLPFWLISKFFIGPIKLKFLSLNTPWLWQMWLESKNWSSELVLPLLRTASLQPNTTKLLNLKMQSWLPSGQNKHFYLNSPGKVFRKSIMPRT